MIYHNLELHNVEALRPYGGGVILQRFPERVRCGMEKRRNFRAADSPGVEIRFASDAYCVELVLQCLFGGGNISVFRGPHLFAVYPAAGGQTVTLHLEPNEEWKAADFGDRPVWARNLWRIQLPPAQFALCHVEDYGSPLRPPAEGERPAKTLLAYGSSITHGCYAGNNSLSYIQHAAARLGWDVRNLGLSGACYCESAMADFLAELSWDAAYLELGINMRPFFSAEEFQSRVEHLLVRLRESHPDKPVFLTTIYPNLETYRRGDSPLKRREEAYNRILRELACREEFGVSLIEGTEVLDDPCCLGADLIHPNDYGHVRMGENLAAILKERLDSGGKGESV